MIKATVLLVLIFATGIAHANSKNILKDLSSCLAKDTTNSVAIECYAASTLRSNREIKVQVARLMKNLEDPGAHNRDRANVPPSFARHLRALQAYQATSAEIAELTDDGTGSDMAVASSQAEFEIPWNELVRLERQ